jgi:lipoate-protein ligase B
MPSVRDWGLRDYGASLEEMRSLVRARRAGAIDDTLVLVEHPPVVTRRLPDRRPRAAGS